MKPFNLPTYCKRQDISHRRLSEMLNISHSYACQLRLGRKPITLRMAMKLSKRLDLPLGAFFKGIKTAGNNHK